jgi:hypothetical protein
MYIYIFICKCVYIFIYIFLLIFIHTNIYIFLDINLLISTGHQSNVYIESMAIEKQKMGYNAMQVDSRTEALVRYNMMHICINDRFINVYAYMHINVHIYT